MHATVMTTAAVLWGDPELGLAQFDSIVADYGGEPGNGNTWRPLLLRCRAELLLSLGAVNRAKQIIEDLLANAEDSVSAAPAACVVCEQAGTLVPFAALPSQVRTYLVAEHERHHDGIDCYVARATRRGAFDGLRDSLVSPTLVRLTRREQVLLPLLATSATAQEIANQQYVSVNTVRKQEVALRDKVGATSRSDLVRRSRQLGLLNPPAMPGGHS